MGLQKELVSANDWLQKAGAYFEGKRVVLPQKFLLIPMTLASEALVEYKQHENIGAKIKFGLLVVVMVRIADTVFYNNLVKLLNQANPNFPNICQHCIRGQIFGTEMKSYRHAANKNIIHKMENNEIINFNDLEIVEKYYNEIFKLPLMDPVSVPEKKGLILCNSCKKKFELWKKSKGKL